MKRALIAALIAAGSAVADESPFLTGEALQAEIARNCAEGCVVLSPAEAAALTLSVQAMVNEREQKAFEAGFAKGNKSCRNAV
jgi:hypothetical protein